VAGVALAVLVMAGCLAKPTPERTAASPGPTQLSPLTTDQVIQSMVQLSGPTKQNGKSEGGAGFLIRRDSRLFIVSVPHVASFSSRPDLGCRIAQPRGGSQDLLSLRMEDLTSDGQSVRWLAHDSQEVALLPLAPRERYLEHVRKLAIPLEYLSADTSYVPPFVTELMYVGLVSDGGTTTFGVLPKPGDRPLRRGTAVEPRQVATRDVPPYLFWVDGRLPPGFSGGPVWELSSGRPVTCIGVIYGEWESIWGAVAPIAYVQDLLRKAERERTTSPTR